MLPEADQLPRRLTATELLTSTGLHRGLSAATLGTRTEGLTGVLGLACASQALVAVSSTGVREEVALAGVLPHGPSVPCSTSR